MTMQTETEPNFQGRSIEISLTVADIERSLSWYTDVIGFSVDKRHEQDEKLIGVSLNGGDVRILLMQDNGARGTDRIKGEGFSFQLVTADEVDPIAERIRSSEGRLITEPHDMPWGVRAFRASDPDGFRLTFSKKLGE